jgi:hypothetical protein
MPIKLMIVWSGWWHERRDAIAVLGLGKDKCVLENVLF